MADSNDSSQASGLNPTWLSCYYVTKHSWRGKYKRIFAISEDCIATINPGTYEETNKVIGD
jgi:DnaJ family protein C protein 13